MGHWFKQTVLNRGLQIVKKHLKKVSTSLAIREMQIKIIMRFPFTPIKMSKGKKHNESSCWQGCGIRGRLTHYCWECKLAQPQWKSICYFPKKIGNLSTSRPSYNTLGHIPKGCFILLKGHFSTMFITALLIDRN